MYVEGFSNNPNRIPEGEQPRREATGHLLGLPRAAREHLRVSSHESVNLRTEVRLGLDEGVDVPKPVVALLHQLRGRLLQ